MNRKQIFFPSPRLSDFLMPLLHFLTPHDEHESGDRKEWRKIRRKSSHIATWSTYTWSRFDYRVKAKSKKTVTLSHARVHNIEWNIIAYALFLRGAKKRAPLSATKVRANHVCNTEITTLKHNLSASTIPCREACAKLPHNTIAPQSKACQVRFSKPLLRTVKSAFSRLFSCFPLLSVLPLHYENETQGQLQRT